MTPQIIPPTPVCLTFALIFLAAGIIGLFLLRK